MKLFRHEFTLRVRDVIDRSDAMTACLCWVTSSVSRIARYGQGMTGSCSPRSSVNRGRRQGRGRIQSTKAGWLAPNCPSGCLPQAGSPPRRTVSRWSGWGPQPVTMHHVYRSLENTRNALSFQQELPSKRKKPTKLSECCVNGQPRRR